MEIGRFVYGGFQMPKSIVHFHSKEAMEIFEGMKIGKIVNEIAPQIFKPVNSEVSLQPQECTWKLASKKMITSCHAVFQFHCDQYKIAGMLPYFDHCGKYYTLTSTHLNMSRNLACIFTPTDIMIPHYLKLIEAFTKGEEYATPYPNMNEITKDNLELYIKKMGPFSSFMHDFPIGQESEKGIKNEFKIRGPYVFFIMLFYRALD